MTAADRKVLREAGPVWSRRFHPADVHGACWIMVSRCCGDWPMEFADRLSKAIERLLNDAARPPDKDVEARLRSWHSEKPLIRQAKKRRKR